MRVQRKEIKKPNSERVRYSITELTPVEFESIYKGLQLIASEQADGVASALLKSFTDLEQEK